MLSVDPVLVLLVKVVPESVTASTKYSFEADTASQLRSTVVLVALEVRRFLGAAVLTSDVFTTVTELAK